MVFLYATDLHGSTFKYEAILSFAIDQGIKIIHIGCDVLPKGSGILEIQKKFVNGYLKDFNDRCFKNGIDLLLFWGNDDLQNRKKYFKKYSTLLNEVPFQKDGYTFRAYPYVLDYPFGLKDSCKLEYPGWKCPEPYISRPVEATDQGLVPIEDIEKYFKEKGTIQEDLDALHVDPKTIMAIHQPPWGLSLDVCADGRRVGSKSVYEFIEKNHNNIPLALFGHLHESREMTGIWKVMVGKTLCIQPGQAVDKTTMVYIEIDENNVKTELIER